MSEIKHERLIVFTRYPEAGKTKTRLIPVLGEQGAADLQRRMTEHLIAKLDNLLPSRPLSLEIRYEGGDEALMRSWLGSRFTYHPQPSGHIGQRMRTAFDEAFESGAQKAIIIGTDIPGISADLISNAFDQLDRHDLVFGPARDGGYYLIGIQKKTWSKVNPVLFQKIAWGSAEVLSQTLATSGKINLQYVLLETLEGDPFRKVPVFYEEMRKELSL